MSHDIGEIADAVLHEGYLLYPYQASSLKNLRRYPFGTLYPEQFCRALDAGDACAARLECVVVGLAEATLTVQARFLQMQGAEGVVRDVSVSQLQLKALGTVCQRHAFQFSPVCGELSIEATNAGGARWKVVIQLRNVTRLSESEAQDVDAALLRSLCAAHLVVRSAEAELVSSIDPAPDVSDLVASCQSVGLWPVLVGKPGSRDALLAAPIVLYDYPELAPESAGDFFDATEIDELLTLRVLTLTDQEKRAMSEGDPRARELLERTEAEGMARLGRLHGRLRPRPSFEPGARVRIRPSGRADIFDLVLDGKAATVQALEHDLEGRSYVVVTIDEDPGKDLGAYAHRFFFRPEEVELL